MGHHVGWKYLSHDGEKAHLTHMPVCAMLLSMHWKQAWTAVTSDRKRKAVKRDC